MKITITILLLALIGLIGSAAANTVNLFQKIDIVGVSLESGETVLADTYNINEGVSNTDTISGVSITNERYTLFRQRLEAGSMVQEGIIVSAVNGKHTKDGTFNSNLFV